MMKKDEEIYVEIIQRRIKRANAKGHEEVAQTLTGFLERKPDTDTLRRMADLVLATSGVSQ